MQQQQQQQQQQHPPQQHPHQQQQPSPSPAHPRIIKPEDGAGDSGGDYNSSRQSSQQVGGPTPGEDIEMQER
jgi:hypothetical protein